MRTLRHSAAVPILALVHLGCSGGEASTVTESGEAVSSVSLSLSTTDTYEMQGIDGGKCVDIRQCGHSGRHRRATGVL